MLQGKSVVKNNLERMRWKRENPVYKGLWRESLRLELMRREPGRTDRWTPSPIGNMSNTKGYLVLDWRDCTKRWEQTDVQESSDGWAQAILPPGIARNHQSTRGFASKRVQNDTHH
jgi:hypothetical protein